MSPHRITKKEIKEDKFVTYTLKLNEWIREHLNHVLIAAGGAVVVAVIVFFIFSSKAKKERNAAELLGKAGIELQTGDLGAATGDLQKVINQFGNTESSGRATFLLASAYFYARDYNQAQSNFEKYLDKFKNDPLTRAAAQAGIADCYMQKGNFLLAGDNYVQAVSLYPEGFLAPEYLLGAADAYLKADQKDKAREVFNRIIKDYPNSRQVNQAKMQLSEYL
jgi:outer membrane protein assembly factor BamD (BamD/ComL family)